MAVESDSLDREHLQVRNSGEARAVVQDALVNPFTKQRLVDGLPSPRNHDHSGGAELRLQAGEESGLHDGMPNAFGANQIWVLWDRYLA